MKSIVFSISLLVLGCVSAMACVCTEIEPNSHWIFFTGYYADDEWQTNQNIIFREENIKFWYDYVGNSVSREAVEDALYRENLLNVNTQNEFFRFLINKHDTIALQYWMSLKTVDSAGYEAIRWHRSAWNFSNDMYSVDDTLDLSIIKVRNLNADCIETCPDKNIRNRYVLQVMRKYFYMNDYVTCIDVWKKYGKNVPQSALRTQCLNYYAGALLRTGDRVEAAVVYAELGYSNVYQHYDPDILREIYLRNPNCKMFEFLVQQFVNQYFDNPLPIKAKDFDELVDEIIKDGKSENPALWKSAQAAIAYVNKNTDKAISLLSQAEKMRGSSIVKENIRMMRLLFNSTRTDNDNKYEEMMFRDFKWLVENIKNDTTYCLGYNGVFSGICSEEINYHSNLQFHRLKILRRVVFLGVVPHFERIGKTYKSIAYLNMFDEVTFGEKHVRELARECKDDECSSVGHEKSPYLTSITYFDYDWDDAFPFREFYKKITEKVEDCYSQKSYDYGGNMFNSIDTAKIGDILQYVNFLQSGGSSPMEKYVVKNSYRDMNYFYDIIGTKYMCEGKYGLAISYLQRVDPNFIKTQNISEYISKERNPFAEKWITKKSECGKYKLSFNPVAEYESNPGKLEFCSIMLKLQKNIYTARSSEEKAYSMYAYAIGLYQSVFGYAWALTDYSHNYWDDEDTVWMSDDKQHVRKKIDHYIETAMKYHDESVFLMKCMIIHSDFRNKLQYNYHDSFRPEFVAAFCDRACDYADNTDN